MEKWINKTKSEEYIRIILGTFLMAAAVNIVFEPMGLVTGGVSGFAIVIKHFTGGLLSGGIPIWLTNTVINVPLFLAAFFVLGKEYIGKTLFAAISFTVGLSIIPSIAVPNMDILLAAVFGGLMNGVGIGLVFTTSASTGGTDLLGSIIHAKVKYYSVAQVLLFIDAAVVFLGVAVFGLNRGLYAVIAVYITTKVMDGILEGLKFAKLAYIISDHEEEIAKEILHSMERGVTGISARGMYQNKQKNMLFCVVSKKEVVQLMEIVVKIDSKAFLIVSDVREVLGEGFIEYKQ